MTPLKAIAALFLTTLWALSIQADINCYAGYSEQPNLPSNAMKYPLPDTSACYKTYQILSTYQTLANGTRAKVNDAVSYSWGGTDLAASQGLLQCRDTNEMTTTSGSMPGNYTQSIYTRTCMCCGDQCNDARMDASCNDKPMFTHNCYGAMERQPKLPSYAIELPSTQQMTCFKGTIFDIKTGSTYFWGATNLNTTHQCPESIFVPYTGLYKFCTCCSDLCNDASMDSIKSTDTSCGNRDVRPDTIFKQMRMPNAFLFPTL